MTTEVQKKRNFIALLAAYFAANIIFIMSLITVNLGVVNMLPFPALDGGRFVFLLIEAIIRRPIPRKFEYIVNGVGLAILIMFIIAISVKDVWQLITGTFPSIS